jgi:hypothetical protein
MTEESDVGLSVGVSSSFWVIFKINYSKIGAL